MFSFHRPKVYRSTQGCCICKAKSSSSRFTDSKKYENDFIKCFQLHESRQGEICNACVLLVKRFKRLPPDSDRHWSHVVDARIGPGLKSMSKCKKRKEEQEQNGTTTFSGQSSSSAQNIRNNERFRKICKKNKLKNKSNLCDENLSPTSPSSNSDTDRISDDIIDIIDGNSIDVLNNLAQSRRIRRKSINPQKNRIVRRDITMIDFNFWTCVKTCCGIIYENKDCSAVLVDFDQYTVDSCREHYKNNNISMCSKVELTSVIKSLPPKKQHIHRQNMIESSAVETHIQTAPIDYSISNVSNKNCVVASQIVEQCSDATIYNLTEENRSASGSLNKTKLNTNKILKKSVTRLLPKKASADLSVMKNLVKLCTDRRATLSNNCELKYIHNENKNITNTPNIEPLIINKYNDNSSDSGYDETLNDTNQLNRIAAMNTARPSNSGQTENLIIVSNLSGEAAQSVIKITQTRPVNQQRLYAKKSITNASIHESIQNKPNDAIHSVYAVNSNALAVANNS